VNDNPDAIKRLLKAHVEGTLWINEKLSKTNNTNKNDNNSYNKLTDVVSAFNNGLINLTGKTHSMPLLDKEFSRLEFTIDPLSRSLIEIIKGAGEIDYVKI
jgi:NitT/TauT family transport system substrate-binding protein